MSQPSLSLRYLTMSSASPSNNILCFNSISIISLRHRVRCTHVRIDMSDRCLVYDDLAELYIRTE